MTEREKSEPAGDSTGSREASVSDFDAEEREFSESDILQAFGKLKETKEPERRPEETGETVKVKEEIKREADPGFEPAPGTEVSAEIREEKWEAEQETAEPEDGEKRDWYEPEKSEWQTPMTDAEKSSNRSPQKSSLTVGRGKKKRPIPENRNRPEIRKQWGREAMK